MSVRIIYIFIIDAASVLFYYVILINPVSCRNFLQHLLLFDCWLVFLFVTTFSTAEMGYYTIHYAWSSPLGTGCAGMSEGMRG